MEIHATDGHLGRVQEFYFDDDRWAVRYLIVKTGSWLVGRHVLLPPWSIRAIDWTQFALSVSLTTDQIRQSPAVDTVVPVSRQRQLEYARYFQEPADWAYGFGVAVAVRQLEASARATAAAEEAAGTPPPTHLRSSADVTGYRIEAVDGASGHLRDFIVDDESWRVPYLAVEPAGMVGHEVLIPTECVQRISWGDRAIFVSLSANAIRESPTFKTVTRSVSP